jgi:hypothetical protein
VHQLKRKLATVALALLTSVGVLLAVATPAHAATWYQTTGSDARCSWTESCWVEYTGTWPSNLVRAAADSNLYSITLMVSTNGGSTWSTAAVVYHGGAGWPRTPAVGISKFGTYAPVIQTIAGGKRFWGGWIYLGD